jgi:23S rRNA pseudouridine1911/1915/1917 synthase
MAIFDLIGDVDCGVVIEDGGLRIAGKDGRNSVKERQRPQPEELGIRILYEDASMLVLDKPAGTVVHPTYRNSSGTLLNGVLWHLRDRAGASPGILTRLDKDTSGLVVLGIDAASHAAMQKDAHAGRVIKEYLAIVWGRPSPPQGTIAFPLGRDTADRRLVVVRPDGQACETRYETLATVETAADLVSALRCVPVTGRTHQIRVHLSASGWPIAGDRVYGRRGEDVPRQALHAWRIRLPHPVTRQPLSFEAPLPEDLGALLQNFTL